jgi:hypothetical protein
VIDLDKLELYDLRYADGKFINKKITKTNFKFLELFSQKYNIVIHISGSSISTDYFRKLIEKIIPMNNYTRWNS